MYNDPGYFIVFMIIGISIIYLLIDISWNTKQEIKYHKCCIRKVRKKWKKKEK